MSSTQLFHTEAAPGGFPTPPRPSDPTLPALRTGAHPRAVLALIGFGALASLWLWWHNTPAVAGLGDWLTNAGRITGLLAGYGVVVLVALMARIPALERGIGADNLARWHAHGGRYTVSLVVAHGLLILWGYAVSAHAGLIDQAGTLLTSYPDVLMATVAGLLLVAVGAVSARAARRRLRYETWYYLHLYTYLAVALAFSHQFATGAEFMNNLAARVVWSGMYAVVGALLLWYRVLVPIRQAFRHQLRVQRVQREGRGVVSLIVTGRNVAELKPEAGQFFRWRFLTRDLWWTSTPYSLSALPVGNAMRVTVKDLGGHSGALAHVRPGTRVLVEGPYGAITPVRTRNRRIVLIAGGIGITPIRALVDALSATPGREITVLYRASTDKDVIFRDELTAIATQRGVRLHILTGRRSQLGYDPLSATALQANIPALRDCDVFVCGPGPMMSAVISALRAAGVRRRQIHHESFEF